MNLVEKLFDEISSMIETIEKLEIQLDEDINSINPKEIKTLNEKIFNAKELLANLEDKLLYVENPDDDEI